MAYYVLYHSPVGCLYVEENNGAITRLSFSMLPENKCTATAQLTPLLKRAAQELDQYFRGCRQKFDLPLAPQGTPFMKKVWRQLCQIPYGRTVSYQDVAVQIGHPRACRAVGLANNHNPIAIFIPCHRVIGKNGSLVGFGGGLEIKKYLLTLEKEHFHA